MKKETVIKNEWEHVWYCKLTELQSDPKVNGTKITFSVPVRTEFYIYSVIFNNDLNVYNKLSSIKILWYLLESKQRGLYVNLYCAM